jgi:(2Fe-2S) ferredoxin
VDSKFKRHFFVCQTRRPAAAGKPSCGHRGSEEILNRLMEALGDHPELWNDVAVTATGCLGPCFDGPTMVVYPEGFWYAPVRPEDLQEIVDRHLVEGVAVERLRYRWGE